MGVAMPVCLSCGGRPSLSDAEAGDGGGDVGAIPEQSAPVSAPVVDVYFENSGSMYGYVNGATELKDIVYDYLTSLETSGAVSAIRLSYINSKVLPAGGDIGSFVKTLTPASLRRKGGDMGTSDLASMLGRIIAACGDTAVAVFISDCIFSPGKGVDAAAYLARQQISIRRAFAAGVRTQPRLSAVGYLCYSMFDGTYYDAGDRPSAFKGQRPFYIWLFGAESALRRVAGAVPAGGFFGDGVRDSVVIAGGGRELSARQYAIHPGSGHFDLSHADARHTLEHLGRDRGGKYVFAVDADFSSVFVSEAFLADTANYHTDNAAYRVVGVKALQEASAMFTHRVRLEATHVVPGRLTVSLRSCLPPWVWRVNDATGDALTDSTAAMTFGIASMVRGIADGIWRDSDRQVSFTVNIK